MTNTDTTNIAVNTMEDLETVCGLCADSGETVSFTAKDRDMVIMDNETYEQLKFELFRAKLESDVFCSALHAERGEVTDAEDFFNEMRSKYGY